MGRFYRHRQQFIRRFTKKSSSIKSNSQSIVETLEPRMLLAADPIISEFQARNSTTIADEDGDFSDWIEIRNTDSEPVDLNGWYLTDDETELNKWQLPAVTLPAGEEILVFASSKDRATAGSELHTNFRLSGDGEYLALVQPDGVTVSQDFGADGYPEQMEDQSYGLGVARDSVIAVADESEAKAFVPTDDSLGTSWTQVGFDDAAWAAGTTGVGYEVLKPGFTENYTFENGLGDEWTVDIPEGAVGTVSVDGGVVTINVPESGQDATSEDRGLAPLVYRDLPGESPADWEVIVNAERSGSANAGIVIYDAATGRPAVTFEHRSSRNFILTSGTNDDLDVRGDRGDNFHLRLVRDGFAKTFTAYYKIEADAEWELVGSVTDGVDGAAVVTDPKVGMIARTPRSTMEAKFFSFDVIVADQRPVYAPQTGLDVEAQMKDNNSSVYMRFPFNIEGDPSRFDELDFTAFYDDGFRAYLNGTEVTAQNVPVIGSWDAAASGVRGAVGGRIPAQQIDLAGSIGLLNEGANVFAVQGMNVAADDSDFFFDLQLIASDFQPLSETIFAVPSPGAPNLLPGAPAPQIVAKQGVFFGSQTIELNVLSDTPTLEVRYTLDGNEPTQASQLYTGPITLTESAMLQARTFDSLPIPKFEPSNISSGTFIAVSEELRDRDSNIPIVLIDTLGQGLPGTAATTLVPLNVVSFEVSEATGRASIDGVVDYLGRGGARDRGSSTAGQAKPNMAFEIWGPNGTTQDDDFDTEFVGLTSGSDYVMHAPFNFDRALMRNQVAYGMSRQMDMWASGFRNVEVFLNRGNGVVEADDYMGVYAALEKIEQGPNRVDVADIDPSVTEEPDISGGYMWKVDRSDPAEPGFNAGRQGIQWVYPKSPRSSTAREDQKATEAQQEWVENYFDQFAETLAEPDINDPEGYSKFINAVQWADQHILNVWMMNVDAMRLSAHFNKDRNGKVNYGPVWDFDRSAESQDARDDDPLVWRSEIPDFGTDFFGNGTQRWWGDLFDDPGFWQVYVDRWQMWRQSALSDENIVNYIDSLADELRESAERNFEARVNRGVRPRSNSNYENNTLDGTWEGEVTNLKTWLLERAAFMDSNFANQPIVKVGDEEIGNISGSLVSAGTEVSLASPEIQFFEDDVLISREPGATTVSYFVPTNDDLGDTWAAADFDDSSWATGELGIGFDERDRINADIRTTVDPRAVQEGATTIMVRIPFEVPDLADFREREFLLRAQFDDGVVIYLNGTEIGRESVRDNELAWNSRGRSRQDVLEFTEIPVIEDASNLLVDGTNVLAVRLINSSGTNSDMLLQPELIGRKILFGPSPAAKVYYTLDGSDPRGPDGNPSPTAIEATPESPITVNENVRVIARNLDPINRGPESEIVETDWSGPKELNFLVADTTLQISELNYNPTGPTQAEQDAVAGIDLTDESFEFVEIYNPTDQEQSLIGVELSDGVEFDFTTGAVTSLAPGGFALIVANQQAFEARYGNGHTIAGEFTGNLANNGEDVDLIGGLGSVLFSVNYSDADPWAMTADGLGATLELADAANTDAARQGKYYSWTGSTEPGGTPGAASSGSLGVVINEVVANTTGLADLNDSIELHNTSGAAIDISGWQLSDTADQFDKFQIPAGTVLEAGAYVVFDESQFNADDDDDGFGLSSDRGDSVYLTQTDADGNVTAFVDDVHFRESEVGRSLARIPNGAGRLGPAAANTLGATNGAHQVGGIVVSELNYNPGLPSQAALEVNPSMTDNDLEFVEIANTTGAAIDLTNWRLRGGADYNFADGQTLAAGGRLVVVKFNPDNPENVNRVAAFRAHYGIDDTIQLVGGYGGQLNNSDDDVVVLSPIASPADRPNFVPRVQADEVLYDDLAPWPVAADGTGSSLQRVDLTALGNAASSWVAGVPTPGTAGDIVAPIRGDFDASGTVDAADINLLFEQIRSGANNGAFDLTADGLVDAADRDELVMTILGTNYGDANLNGIFDQMDFISIFAAGEYEDGIDGNSTWETGDWDGDGDFTSQDLVLAFLRDGFDNSPVAAVARTSLGAAISHGENDRSTTEANLEELADLPLARMQARQLETPSSHDSVFANGEVDQITSDDAVDGLSDSLLNDLTQE